MAGEGPDLAAAAAALVAKQNGDATAALTKLLDENHDLREKNRDLKKERDEAAKRVPDGALVLTGADKAAYDAYVALGDPKALAKKLEDGDAAQASLAAKQRDEAITDAADAAGFKPAVLRRLARDPEAGFSVAEVKEETVDGQTVRVPYVRKAGEEKGAPVKLADYVAEHFAEFGDALKQPAATGRGPIAPPAGKAGGSGTTWVSEQTRTTGTGPKQDVAEEFIRRVTEAGQARPNPLRPATR